MSAWEECVVRILREHDSLLPEEPEFLGTGFAVGPDLVLTARHVVRARAESVICPEADFDPIRVTRHHQGKKEIDSKVSRILWPDDSVPLKGNVDIALLCVAPKTFDHWIHLSDQRWTVASRPFRSFGYVRKKDSEATEWRPRGETGSHEDSLRAMLQVHFDHPKDDVLKWKGCSGAPVMVGSLAVGVLIECADEETGKLWAAPIELALKDPKFRNFLPTAEEVLRSWLSTFLGGSREMASFLSSEFHSDSSDPEWLVNKLVNGDVVEVVRTLGKAHKTCCDTHETEHRNRDRKVWKMRASTTLRILLVTASQRIKTSMTHGPSATHRIVNGTVIAAELLLAKEQNAPPQFVSGNSDSMVVNPIGCIEPYPRLGRKPHAIIEEYFREKAMRINGSKAINEWALELRPNGLDATEGLIHWLMMSNDVASTWTKEDLERAANEFWSIPIVQLSGKSDDGDGSVAAIISMAVKRHRKCFRKG